MWTRRITLLLVLVQAATAAAQSGRAHIADDACEKLPLAPPPRRATDAPLPAQAEADPAAVNAVRRILDKTTQDKIAAVKQSLASKRPVLFIMPQPEAGKLVGDLWVAAEGGLPTPGNAAPSRCGNAMVMVGYDDARYGGAFELVRDCGATMYTEAAFWMRYADFSTLCQCAVELVATAGTTAAPADGATTTTDTTPVAPSAESTRSMTRDAGADLSATVRFQEASGAAMPVEWTGQAYRMQRSYQSGTRFRVTITSDNPAYVYALGSDSTQRIFPVFPPVGGASRKERTVTLPEPSGFLQMDNVPGTDYLCVLLSERALELASLVDRLAASDGTLSSRVQSVLGATTAPPGDIRPSETGTIGILANNPSIEVVPIIVEIPHAE